jgi:subtilisin family serine protease
MVGDDGQGNQIGVAPGARWVGVRNMERGWGSPATYLEGFEWFLAPTDLNGENPQPEMAPHVINNSWTCPPVEGCNAGNWEVMNQAVNALRAAGVVVVVSAGNSGPSCATVRDPAAIFEGSFSVGATRPNDTIAGFSSRGPVLADGSLRLKPDVSAPGVSVRSCIPGGQYAASSGTSMAGPHVAGAVALIISAVPQLAGEVDSIEAILRRTAVPKLADQDCEVYSGQQVPNAVYGYGRIDVLAAVLEAQRTITQTNDLEAGGGVRIFPNPANNWVQLSWAAEQQWDKMELFGADGRLLLSQSVAGKTWVDLSLAAFPAGVYHYRLAGRQGNQTMGRIVRQ